MQNFTGAGFSNEEIKKEDIAKQIKNKADAIRSLNRMSMLSRMFGSAKLEQGGFISLDENRSKKAEQQAEEFNKEIEQLLKQIVKYLEAMPHD